MKETKNSQKVTANTATESKNSSNRRTVKNNKTEETMKKTATTAAAPKKGAAASKNTAKKTTASTTTNAGRVSNHKTQQAAARQAQREAEEKELQAQREKLQKEAEAKKRAEEKETAREAKQNINAAYSAAGKTVSDIVKKEKSALWCFHWLNKAATTGAEFTGVEFSPESLLTVYELQGKQTPTARNLAGFSYDSVRINSRGQLCKMTAYKEQAGDEIEAVYTGRSYHKIQFECKTDILYHIARTKEHPEGVEIIENYNGTYILEPVVISRNTVLQAARTVSIAYTTAATDLANIYTKANETRKAKEAAQKAAAKAAAALIAAEKAQKEAEEDQKKTAAAVDEMKNTTTRRPWWQKIAAVF